MRLITHRYDLAAVPAIPKEYLELFGAVKHHSHRGENPGKSPERGVGNSIPFRDCAKGCERKDWTAKHHSRAARLTEDPLLSTPVIRVESGGATVLSEG